MIVIPVSCRVPHPPFLVRYGAPPKGASQRKKGRERQGKQNAEYPLFAARWRMLIAKDSEGARVNALPGETAYCPSCNSPLMAKCGEINQWHWAHLAGPDCDQWSEPESEWHIDWKMLFQPWEREVVIGPHRADISTFGGKIIELQHSAIAPKVIREREDFYGPNMIWVVDSEEFLNNFLFFNKSTHWSFKWRWCRKAWLSARRPVWIDLRDGFVFHAARIMPNGTGYGKFHNAEEFVRSLGATTNATLPTLDVNRCGKCGRNGTTYEYGTGQWQDRRCRFCTAISRSNASEKKQAAVEAFRGIHS